MPAKKEPVYTRYTARNIGFLVAYVLLVAVVIANLGIVSHILNTVGNPEDRYPSREFKHVLGLLLFVNIFTLLHSFAVFHLYTLLIAFFQLASAVMYWTSAGVIFQVVPYETYPKGFAGYAQEWTQQPWIGWKNEIIALQGLSWAAGGISLITMIGILAGALSVHIARREMWDMPPPKAPIADEKQKESA